MVLKQLAYWAISVDWFENDVEMYGAQTPKRLSSLSSLFENDVEMYGAQTEALLSVLFAIV